MPNTILTEEDFNILDKRVMEACSKAMKGPLSFKCNSIINADPVDVTAMGDAYRSLKSGFTGVKARTTQGTPDDFVVIDNVQVPHSGYMLFEDGDNWELEFEVFLKSDQSVTAIKTLEDALCHRKLCSVCLYPAKVAPLISKGLVLRKEISDEGDSRGLYYTVKVQGGREFKKLHDGV